MQEKNNKKLEGLANKIDNLLSEHELNFISVSEIIFKVKDEFFYQRNDDLDNIRRCKIVRDPDTDELIWICN